ncbi:MAG: Hsp20/alpha crystallin family protein [Gammaproteobacteria bacterium]
MTNVTEKTGSKGDVAVTQSTSDSKALHPFEEMDRMFENLMARNWFRPFRWDMPTFDGLRMPVEAKMPRVDVIDRDKEVVIRAEIPGVDKKDLDVSMTDNSITIKGSTRQEKEDKGEDYYRSEISKGSFCRTVAIPDNVDASKVKASFKDGVLELTVPKTKGSKRHSIKLD